MRIAFRLLIGIVGVIVVGVVASQLVSGQNARPTIATEDDFRRAMKELSNWGRWGEMDELGAAMAWFTATSTPWTVTSWWTVRATTACR